MSAAGTSRPAVPVNPVGLASPVSRYIIIGATAKPAEPRISPLIKKAKTCNRRTLIPAARAAS